jgi:hypothetical protein
MRQNGWPAGSALTCKISSVLHRLPDLVVSVIST